MNWLAHFLLSETDSRFRIGNVLPDIIGPAAIKKLAPEYRRGAARHHRIDIYTDAHPLVRRSVARFEVETHLRHFGGVLTDMFYDHLLAQNWNVYSPHMALSDFAAEIYAGIAAHSAELPPEAAARLGLMCEHDWLYSYREPENIALALHRMGMRLRKPFDLSLAIPVFEKERGAFAAEFAAFFPQLAAHAIETRQDINM